LKATAEVAGFKEGMELRKRHVKLLFYEDAPDATVSVEQGDNIGTSDSVSLRINGKADASSAIDLNTQLLSGHLPLLAKPDSKDVFILGLGSGITGGAVIAHPVTNLVIADNCEPVFRGRSSVAGRCPGAPETLTAKVRRDHH
jgi:hypothetical protein